MQKLWYIRFVANLIPSSSWVSLRLPHYDVICKPDMEHRCRWKLSVTNSLLLSVMRFCSDYISHLLHQQVSEWLRQKKMPAVLSKPLTNKHKQPSVLLHQTQISAYPAFSLLAPKDCSYLGRNLDCMAGAKKKKAFAVILFARCSFQEAFNGNVTLFNVNDVIVTQTHAVVIMKPSWYSKLCTKCIFRIFAFKSSTIL